MKLTELYKTPDLKNALRYLKSKEVPVVITKHGDPQGVLLPIALFEEYLGSVDLPEPEEMEYQTEE